MKITLLPKTGADIDGKKLVLGCTREQAEEVIGKPEDDFGICYYSGGGLALDFGEDGILRYIECRTGTDTEIYGVNAFNTDAEQLCEILAAENGDDIMDIEDGHSLMFNKIRVTVWREFTPDDFDEADPEEERHSAAHWHTVGVFAQGYYG